MEDLKVKDQVFFPGSCTGLLKDSYLCFSVCLPVKVPQQHSTIGMCSFAGVLQLYERFWTRMSIWDMLSP